MEGGGEREERRKEQDHMSSEEIIARKFPNAFRIINENFVVGSYVSQALIQALMKDISPQPTTKKTVRKVDLLTILWRLPPEEILTYLDLFSLGSLRQVCKCMDLIDAPTCSLWKQCYMRVFPERLFPKYWAPTSSLDWKNRAKARVVSRSALIKSSDTIQSSGQSSYCVSCQSPANCYGVMDALLTAVLCGRFFTTSDYYESYYETDSDEDEEDGDEEGKNRYRRALYQISRSACHGPEFERDVAAIASMGPIVYPNTRQEVEEANDIFLDLESLDSRTMFNRSLLSKRLYGDDENRDNTVVWWTEDGKDIFQDAVTLRSVGEVFSVVHSPLSGSFGVTTTDDYRICIDQNSVWTMMLVYGFYSSYGVEYWDRQLFETRETMLGRSNKCIISCSLCGDREKGCVPCKANSEVFCVSKVNNYRALMVEEN